MRLHDVLWRSGRGGNSGDPGLYGDGVKKRVYSRLFILSVDLNCGVLRSTLCMGGICFEPVLVRVTPGSAL